MKKVKQLNKKSFFKTKFIQFCRLLGYEIIDQNSFEVPTLNKKLTESLGIPGKKSISIPLGEVKITRQVKSLTVYFRSCAKVHLWEQNKTRIFAQPKSEYSLRSLKSILKAITYAEEKLNSVNYKVIVIDDNSEKNFLMDLEKLIKQYKIDVRLISLNSREYEDITQDTNFASIYKSYLLAKEEADDLIYFVEDDYIHEKIAIHEMVLAYERISSQLKKEIIMFPVDYPYLYAQHSPTYIMLGDKRHWRKIDQSLATFLISKEHFVKYWDNFIEFATIVSDPAEKPLHRVYEIESCFSPIPSLALHCTNVNSIYGLSPNIDWKKIWDENQL